MSTEQRTKDGRAGRWDTGRFDVKGFLSDAYRAKNVWDHSRRVLSWKRWQQIAHRIVAWRCPACRAFRRGEHLGWGWEKQS